MSGRAANTTFFPLGLNRDSKVPLERQLYTQLRDAILRGQVRPGWRIPSTRILAGELECSRNTVVGAVELLLAEGYLVGKQGSGTFVAQMLPDELITTGTRTSALHHEDDTVQLELSKRGETMAGYAELRPLKNRPFDIGVPDIEFFPFPLWGRLLAKVWRHPQKELLSYGAPGGYLGLRQQITDYLRQSRGVSCEPGQVFVTSGAQQAFDFLGRMLLDPGDSVWVEDPGYIGSRGALASAGANIVPVEVDDEGINIRSVSRNSARIRAAVVTPSHQFPLGVVMSLQRRLELLNWAEKANAWIIEDDYDSEYRYSGPPLTSLQGLSAGPTNGKGRVIYVGSFSKVLFPGLRLGYMILPLQIADKFSRGRRVLDSQYPSTAQPVIAEFLREGHFLTHVRRMRKLYEGRQKVLRESVETHMGDLVNMPPHDAGMHLIAYFKPNLSQKMDDREAARRAVAAGVYPRPLSEFYIRRSPVQALLLGYSGMKDAQIRKAVTQLSEALLER